MFDCNRFLHRNGWRQKDLAERLGLGTSTVGMWCSGKSNPPYEVIVELIKLGITPEELFGDEINEQLKAFYLSVSNPQLPSRVDNKEFREGMAKSDHPLTREEVIDLFKELSSKGEI